MLVGSVQCTTFCDDLLPYTLATYAALHTHGVIFVAAGTLQASVMQQHRLKPVKSSMKEAVRGSWVGHCALRIHACAVQ